MQVEQILRNYIAETILFSETYPYSDTDSFLDHGVLDSMNVMEIVLFLEHQFGIQVADTEIVPEHFDSIQQLAAFVNLKQQVAA